MDYMVLTFCCLKKTVKLNNLFMVCYQWSYFHNHWFPYPKNFPYPKTNPNFCSQYCACWWPSTVGARPSAGKMLTKFRSHIYIDCYMNGSQVAVAIASFPWHHLRGVVTAKFLGVVDLWWEAFIFITHQTTSGWEWEDWVCWNDLTHLLLWCSFKDVILPIYEMSLKRSAVEISYWYYHWWYGIFLYGHGASHILITFFMFDLLTNLYCTLYILDEMEHDWSR